MPYEEGKDNMLYRRLHRQLEEYSAPHKKKSKNDYQHFHAMVLTRMIHVYVTQTPNFIVQMWTLAPTRWTKNILNFHYFDGIKDF